MFFLHVHPLSSLNNSPLAMYGGVFVGRGGSDMDVSRYTGGIIIVHRLFSMCFNHTYTLWLQLLCNLFMNSFNIWVDVLLWILDMYNSQLFGFWKFCLSYGLLIIFSTFQQYMTSWMQFLRNCWMDFLYILFDELSFVRKCRCLYYTAILFWQIYLELLDEYIFDTSLLKLIL